MALGIRHGQITTIHNPANTNVAANAPHKDLRRARSAMLAACSIITFLLPAEITATPEQAPAE